MAREKFPSNLLIKSSSTSSGRESPGHEFQIISSHSMGQGCLDLFEDWKTISCNRFNLSKMSRNSNKAIVICQAAINGGGDVKEEVEYLREMIGKVKLTFQLELISFACVV